MKLATNDSPVELGESISKPRAFSIANSKEAFSVLSSGLYNNQILAIVRELSCNAYDAHVAAGKKDVPFEIHFPSVFEPFFSIKDNGTGLSDSDVYELYTTYFGTNKSNSNLFIGALGLGSKSPFCYTEGFTVTVRFKGDGHCSRCNEIHRVDVVEDVQAIVEHKRKEGEKEVVCEGSHLPPVNPLSKMERVYSAYMGEEGFYVELQSEEEISDDVENGLEVMFPVKTKDISEFKNNARVALEFFDPLPICNSELSVDKQEYIIKNDKWGLRKDSYTHHGHRVRAIQGMVQYAVGSIDDSKTTSLQKRLLNLPLDIFFNIGDLSVAASRETLKNDPRTVQNILKALDEVFKEIIDEVKKKITEEPTLWGAKIYLRKLRDNEKLGDLITEAIAQGMIDGKYKNFTFDHKSFKLNELDYKAVRLINFTASYRSKSSAAREAIFYLEPEKMAEREKSILMGLTKRENMNRDISPSADDIFIIDDCTRGGEIYIHYFLQEASDNKGQGRKPSAYLIKKINKYVSLETVKKQAEAIIKVLGNPPVMLLSELKQKYRPMMVTTTASGQPVNRDILVFNSHSDYHKHSDGYERSGWRNAWKPLSLVLEEEKEDGVDPIEEAVRYYVPIKSLKPADGSFEYAEDFYKFVNNACRSEVFEGLLAGTRIYAIQEASEIRKQPGWVEIIPHILNQLPKVMTPAREMQVSIAVTNFHTSIDNIILEKVADTKPLNIDSPMQLFCNKLFMAKRGNTAKVQALAEVIRTAKKLEKFTLTKSINFREEWTELTKIYPLLPVISEGYSWNLKIDAFVEYINLIDKERERKEADEVVTLAMAMAQEITDKEDVANVN